MPTDAPPDQEPAPSQRFTRRWGVWRVLLWAALLVSVVFGACLLFILATGISWVGHKDVELCFVVVDAETGSPLEGATIIICKWREEDKPLGRTRTGPDGAGSITVRCWAGGESGWFHHEGGVSFGSLDVLVSKEGYDQVSPEELARHTGPQRRLDDLPPPPVRIEMKKRPRKK